MSRESAKTRHIRGLAQTRGGDDAIADLAGRQHGVISRRQLLGLGLGEDAIDGRIRNGRLHRLHSGVYAVGHSVVSREGQWMAAVLASGPGAVLSHLAAAALWGIRSPPGGAIDITVPHRSRSSRDIRRHLASLPADEVTTRYGIPVTNVPRTIFDLATVNSEQGVEAALRESEYLELRNRLSLHDLLERYPGRRGSRTVRTCLDRRAETLGRIRSPLEEVFLPFLRRHRLPIQQLNAWIDVGGRSFQVDCLWPKPKQVVELDGYKSHGTKAAFRNDRARDRILRVAGYSVTRISWNQLKDEPTAIAADLRTLLAPLETAA